MSHENEFNNNTITTIKHIALKFDELFLTHRGTNERNILPEGKKERAEESLENLTQELEILKLQNLRQKEEIRHLKNKIESRKQAVGI
jgi:hypothetical protein